MATRIQLRRDTAANWTSNNPTLANGEMGVETDTFKFKIGNGSTAWNALQYASSTSSYADSDVNVHLNTSTAASGEYLSWTGSDYDWVAQSVSDSFQRVGPTPVLLGEGSYGIDADFTFEIDFIMPSDNVYRNLFALGANSGTEYYGALYAYTTNSDGFTLISSVSGTTTDGDSIFTQSGSANFNGSRHVMTIVRSGAEVAVWVDGTRVAYHNGTISWPSEAFSNPGLALFAYGDGSIIQSDGTGVEVYATSFTPEALYNPEVTTINTELNSINNELVDNHLNTSTATSGEYLSWNGSDYSWDSVPAGYADSDVGAHLNVISATSGQFLSWNGTDYAWDSADLAATDPLSMYQDAGTAPTPYVWMDFGNNMNDSGSANLPATSGATPVYTSDRDGVSNHAYVFGNGSTLGWVTSPASPNSDFFWGIWYKSDGATFGSNAIILGTAYSVGNELIHIGATPVNSTTAQLQIKHTENGAWVTSVASIQPTWTDWNHYAMVKSGNSLYLYLNGAVVATDTLAGTYTYQNSLNVGLYVSGRATGDYDDIQLYTTIPITAGERFNTNNIGGGAVKVGELEVTGNQTNSLFKVRQYESGVLTEYTTADFVSAGYADSDVNAHLNIDSATSGQFLSWDGTDYAWDSVSASPWTDNTSYVTYVGDVVIGRDISPDNINANWKGITVAGPTGGGINFQNSLGNQLAGRIIGNGASLQIRPGTGGNIQLEDPLGADVLKINNDKTVEFAGAFTFPNTDGTANQVLTTDGAGTVTWNSAGGGGLDSAAVATLIDSDLQNPTTLTIGSSSSKIVIGSGASTSGSSTVSVGINSTTSANASVAVGSSSNVSSIGGVAIGLRASATGSASVAVGGDADATGSGNTAFGHTSQATAAGGGATSIGGSSNATGTGTTAIGRITNSSGTYSTSLGYNARTSGNYSIAIGADTLSSGNNSICISADTSSFTNSNVNGIDIRTSDSASIHYSQDSDFVFGAGVTMTDLVSTGATIVFNNLPTSDPVNAGQLWNDSGTLKVSAG